MKNKTIQNDLTLLKQINELIMQKIIIPENVELIINDILNGTLLNFETKITLISFINEHKAPEYNLLMTENIQDQIKKRIINLKPLELDKSESIKIKRTITKSNMIDYKNPKIVKPTIIYQRAA